MPGDMYMTPCNESEKLLSVCSQQIGHDKFYDIYTTIV